MAMKPLAKEFGFGTWNVRTMRRSGSIIELIPQIKEHNIHVMAIQETRWQWAAIIDLKVIQCYRPGETQAEGNLE